MSDLRINMKCEFCDIEFTAIRPSAKFCSNSCRTKANVQRRENEKIETQKAEKQAVIEQAKRAAAEARKLKKAEKEAEHTEAKRQAEKELEIQAEIDAHELAEKNRGIISILEQLKARQEERSKLLQEEKRRKNEERKIAFDIKLRDARIRGELIGKVLAEIIIWVINHNNNSAKI